MKAMFWENFEKMYENLWGNIYFKKNLKNMTKILWDVIALFLFKINAWYKIPHVSGTEWIWKNSEYVLRMIRLN